MHVHLAFLVLVTAALPAQRGGGDPPFSLPPRPGTGTPAAPGLILPAAYASQWGELANAFPLGTAQMRYQQVFLGSEVTAATLVVGVGFREDDQGNRASGGIADVTVKLGLTTFDHTTIGATSTFDSNYDLGGSTTLVDGTVNLPGLAGTNVNLGVFAVQLAAEAPYLLAPGPGQNVLLEVINRSSSNTGFYDKVHNSPLVGTTARIWATSAAATAATRGLRNEGLVLCLLAQGGGCAPPAFGTFGIGCAGSNGVPQHTAAGLPTLGTNFTLTLASARANAQALLFADIQRTNWLGIPLPIGLDFLGGIGCTLYAPGTLQVSVSTDPTGAASVTLNLPSLQSLCGTTLSSQFVVVDPANALGLVLSNAAQARLGI